MKKRQKPSITKGSGSAAVTCYNPMDHARPSLKPTGSGAVTCYKPRKK